MFQRGPSHIVTARTSVVLIFLGEVDEHQFSTSPFQILQCFSKHFYQAILLPLLSNPACRCQERSPSWQCRGRGSLQLKGEKWRKQGRRQNMLSLPSFPSQVLGSSRGETDSCDPSNMQLVPKVTTKCLIKTCLRSIFVAGRPGREHTTSQGMWTLDEAQRSFPTLAIWHDSGKCNSLPQNGCHFPTAIQAGPRG